MFTNGFRICQCESVDPILVIPVPTPRPPRRVPLRYTKLQCAVQFNLWICLDTLTNTHFPDQMALERVCGASRVVSQIGSSLVQGRCPCLHDLAAWSVFGFSKVGGPIFGSPYKQGSLCVQVFSGHPPTFWKLPCALLGP